MVRWCGTCRDKLPGSFVEVEQQQETNALDEQVVIQHETVQLHETQSRQDLEFQSHVSTLRLQVERVDSVGPPPVLSWLQVVLAVARPCHSAPFLNLSLALHLPRHSMEYRVGPKDQQMCFEASVEPSLAGAWLLCHTTQYVSASEKFTHVLYCTSKPDKLLPNSNCHGEYRRFR